MFLSAILNCQIRYLDRFKKYISTYSRYFPGCKEFVLKILILTYKNIFSRCLIMCFVLPAVKAATSAS